MKTQIYPIVYPNALRRYRKAAGLRQADVARLIGLGGSTERISKWENGAADPNIDNLFRLLVLFKTTPKELYPKTWQAIENPASLPARQVEPVPEGISCHCGRHILPRLAGGESAGTLRQAP
jgi:transcriptional regulator with XRE-family HTH domain